MLMLLFLISLIFCTYVYSYERSWLKTPEVAFFLNLIYSGISLETEILEYKEIMMCLKSDNIGPRS